MQARGIEVPISTVVSDYKRVSDIILSQALSIGLSRKRLPSVDVLIDNYAVPSSSYQAQSNRAAKTIFVTVAYRAPEKTAGNIRLWLDANPASPTYKICYQSSSDGKSWNRIVTYGELTNLFNESPDDFIEADDNTTEIPDPQVLSLSADGVLSLSGGGGSVNLKETLLPIRLTNLDGSIQFSVGT